MEASSRKPVQVPAAQHPPRGLLPASITRPKSLPPHHPLRQNFAPRRVPTRRKEIEQAGYQATAAHKPQTPEPLVSKPAEARS
ncbi:hypothetical protein B0T18DRAFT_412704 [Schizothecium vesticola]|uniref:Uncharacterized protein n=1 Tax=Schizothecium vesticola TaxID=314040 RepID=A0AA40K5N6_9PEZI|nr:hypothetical protein B0T18DRAFT_412704 [Schizothecium vesticola]